MLSHVMVTATIHGILMNPAKGYSQFVIGTRPSRTHDSSNFTIPCLISALLMPTLATPETGPEFDLVATDVFAATTAPEVAGVA